MSKSGQYRIRIRAIKPETGYSDKRNNVLRHSWLAEWSFKSNVPNMHTAELKNARQFDFETAKQVAQAWADCLLRGGFEDAAKRIEICPATGGAACGWRPTILTRQERADVNLINMAFAEQHR